MMSFSKKIVSCDVTRIRSCPPSSVSGSVVNAKSNKSDAVKTRNLLSNSNTRKRKFPVSNNAKHLYIPKTWFEQSQSFKCVQQEPLQQVVSSNKERKRQLNWREFPLDVSGERYDWEKLKNFSLPAAGINYRDIELDDVVFQVIEPVRKPILKVVYVLGRKHVIDCDMSFETQFTSLGKLKSMDRTTIQSVHQNFSNEMETLNEKIDLVAEKVAQPLLAPLDDASSETVKPVVAPRTIFFERKGNNIIPIPKKRNSIPEPVVDFDLVPDLKIFKDVLNSFNPSDPLYLSALAVRDKLVEEAEVKPEVSFADSTRHHKSDVKVDSYKPKPKKEFLGKGSYYTKASCLEVSNLNLYSTYFVEKYVPSFHWCGGGKIERFSAADVDEKKEFVFREVRKVEKYVFDSMTSSGAQIVRRVDYSKSGHPVKHVTYLPKKVTRFEKVYEYKPLPLCKQCKGQGCKKCNLSGSPIMVKPERWFEKVESVDNSINAKNVIVASRKSSEAKKL